MFCKSSSETAVLLVQHCNNCQLSPDMQHCRTVIDFISVIKVQRSNVQSNGPPFRGPVTQRSPTDLRLRSLGRDRSVRDRRFASPLGPDPARGRGHNHSPPGRPADRKGFSDGHIGETPAVGCFLLKLLCFCEEFFPPKSQKTQTISPPREGSFIHGIFVLKN